MTKLLLVSDNHGKTQRLENILNNTEYDLAIHLGDAELSEEFMEKHFDYFVAGNHDAFKDEELVFDIEDVKVVIGHGHRFGHSFFSGKNMAYEFGKRHNADLVIHGHSHVPKFETVEGIKIVCPGSTDYSRSGPNSFVLMTIDKKTINVSFLEADKI